MVVFESIVGTVCFGNAKEAIGDRFFFWNWWMVIFRERMDEVF